MRKVLGLALVALGVLGLVYRGFSYTKETHDAQLGPIELQLKEKERVEVPVWLSVSAVALGAGLLALDARRPRGSR